MNELFEQLARGEMPNIIELMAAISEIADYWPKADCPDCHISPDTQEHTPHAPRQLYAD